MKTRIVFYSCHSCDSWFITRKGRWPMKVVLLCGGLGTRIREQAELLPKPLVPIGGRPIVWHIMDYYARFGFRRFVLCLGYKHDCFVDYFLNYRYRSRDLTVRLGRRRSVRLH